MQPASISARAVASLAACSNSSRCLQLSALASESGGDFILCLFTGGVTVPAAELVFAALAFSSHIFFSSLFFSFSSTCFSMPFFFPFSSPVFLEAAVAVSACFSFSFLVSFLVSFATLSRLLALASRALFKTSSTISAAFALEASFLPSAFSSPKLTFLDDLALVLVARSSLAVGFFKADGLAFARLSLPFPGLEPLLLPMV